MSKAKKTKKTKKTKKPAKRAAKKDKLAGKIEHIFEKIGVVTTTLKNPLKVGDIIRIKGHTTDFIQEVESMQIEHKDVLKAKKGNGIGIKVTGYVRDNDAIYLADKKTAAMFRKNSAGRRPEAAPWQNPVFASAVPVRPKPAESSVKAVRPAEKASPAQPRFFSF